MSLTRPDTMIKNLEANKQAVLKKADTILAAAKAKCEPLLKQAEFFEKMKQDYIALNPYIPGIIKTEANVSASASGAISLDDGEQKLPLDEKASQDAATDREARLYSDAVSFAKEHGKVTAFQLATTLDIDKDEAESIIGTMRDSEVIDRHGKLIIAAVA
jgi:hypothetical protein